MNNLEKMFILACAIAITATNSISAMKRQRDENINCKDEPANKKFCSNSSRQGPNYSRMPLVKYLGNDLYQIGRAKFIEINGYFFHCNKKKNPAQGKDLIALRAYVLAIAQHKALAQQNQEVAAGMIEGGDQGNDRTGMLIKSNTNVLPVSSPFLVIGDPNKPGHVVRYNIRRFFEQLALAHLAKMNCNSQKVYLNDGVECIQQKVENISFLLQETDLFMSVVHKNLCALAEKFEISLQELDAAFVLANGHDNPIVLMLATEKVKNIKIEDDDINYIYFPPASGQEFSVLQNLPMLEDAQTDEQKETVNNTDQDCVIMGFIFGQTQDEDPFLQNSANSKVLVNVLHERGISGQVKYVIMPDDEPFMSGLCCNPFVKAKKFKKLIELDNEIKEPDEELNDHSSQDGNKSDKSDNDEEGCCIQ